MDSNKFAISKSRLATIVALGLITAAHGQFGHEPESAIGTGGGGGGGGNGFHGFRGAPGFDVATAIHYRTIHGILAATSIAVLFPVGGILMRVLPGRLAIWVHAIFQILATCVFIVAAGLGIYLVKNVVIQRGGTTSTLLSDPRSKMHPIMGIVTLVTLLPQPLLGYLHHRKFKQVQRRQFWSYMHIFNGRIGVTVGIVNGFMGLGLAQAPQYYKTVYVVVAAIIWVLWMLTALVYELRRMRRNKRTERAVQRRLEQGMRNLKSVPSSSNQSR